MTDSPLKAFICGVSGVSLNDDERRFIGRERPWGLILFARNCASAEEIRSLVADYRTLIGRADAPVFIDQEGGRVQRIKPPICPAYPPGREFGLLYQRDRDSGARAAYLGARLIADDLHALGINADCLPLLDVPAAGAHDIIGDRAYGMDAEAVVTLGRAVADGLLDGGVLPVIKHIPGHGRAGSDSHLALPVVDAEHTLLSSQDFPPFRELSDLPLAMTAHVVYSAVDPDAPATISNRVINDIIRGEIGFDGCLMSDDVSMQALKGTIGERTERLFMAGCDLALHCNGDLAEMHEVAEATPVLTGRSAERADAAIARLVPPKPLDRDATWSEFASLIAPGTDCAGGVVA